MKKNIHYQTRKLHRYLGIVMGIQFLLWTLGGIYFSWSDMDQVHGDHHKAAPPVFSAHAELISPTVVLAAMQQQQAIDSVISIQLVPVIGKPTYQITYIDHASHTRLTQLADATTGALRTVLSEAEAIAEARSRYSGNADVSRVEYLTETNNHHEYRGGALPAYAISFDDASQTVVYVSAQLGTVQKFRNREWRIFDFLWMLHTMDYQSRDHFGNLLLRSFSILGIITILSGFALYIVSSPLFRQRKQRTIVGR